MATRRGTHTRKRGTGGTSSSSDKIVGSGRRIDFDDDMIVCRNPHGEVTYQGVVDYYPDKDSLDDGTFSFDNKRGLYVTKDGWTVNNITEE